MRSAILFLAQQTLVSCVVRSIESSSDPSALYPTIDNISDDNDGLLRRERSTKSDGLIDKSTTSQTPELVHLCSPDISLNITHQEKPNELLAREQEKPDELPLDWLLDKVPRTFGSGGYPGDSYPWNTDSVGKDGSNANSKSNPESLVNPLTIAALPTDVLDFIDLSGRNGDYELSFWINLPHPPHVDLYDADSQHVDSSLIAKLNDKVKGGSLNGQQNVGGSSLIAKNNNATLQKNMTFEEIWGLDDRKRVVGRNTSEYGDLPEEMKRQMSSLLDENRKINLEHKIEAKQQAMQKLKDQALDFEEAKFQDFARKEAEKNEKSSPKVVVTNYIDALGSKDGKDNDALNVFEQAVGIHRAAVETSIREEEEQRAIRESDREQPMQSTDIGSAGSDMGSPGSAASGTKPMLNPADGLQLPSEETSLLGGGEAFGGLPSQALARQALVGRQTSQMPGGVPQMSPQMPAVSEPAHQFDPTADPVQVASIKAKLANVKNLDDPAEIAAALSSSPSLAETTTPVTIENTLAPVAAESPATTESAAFPTNPGLNPSAAKASADPLQGLTKVDQFQDLLRSFDAESFVGKKELVALPAAQQQDEDPRDRIVGELASSFLEVDNQNCEKISLNLDLDQHGSVGIKNLVKWLTSSLSSLQNDDSGNKNWHHIKLIYKKNHAFGSHHGTKHLLYVDGKYQSNVQIDSKHKTGVDETISNDITTHKDKEMAVQSGDNSKLSPARIEFLKWSGFLKGENLKSFKESKMNQDHEKSPTLTDTCTQPLADVNCIGMPLTANLLAIFDLVGGVQPKQSTTSSSLLEIKTKSITDSDFKEIMDMALYGDGAIGMQAGKLNNRHRSLTRVESEKQAAELLEQSLLTTLNTLQPSNPWELKFRVKISKSGKILSVKGGNSEFVLKMVNNVLRLSLVEIRDGDEYSHEIPMEKTSRNSTKVFGDELQWHTVEWIYNIPRYIDTGASPGTGSPGTASPGTGSPGDVGEEKMQHFLLLDGVVMAHGVLPGNMFTNDVLIGLLNSERTIKFFKPVKDIQYKNTRLRAVLPYNRHCARCKSPLIFSKTVGKTASQRKQSHLSGETFVSGKEEPTSPIVTSDDLEANKGLIVGEEEGTDRRASSNGVELLAVDAKDNGRNNDAHEKNEDAHEDAHEKNEQDAQESINMNSSSPKSTNHEEIIVIGSDGGTDKDEIPRSMTLNEQSTQKNSRVPIIVGLGSLLAIFSFFFFDKKKRKVEEIC